MDRFERLRPPAKEQLRSLDRSRLPRSLTPWRRKNPATHGRPLTDGGSGSPPAPLMLGPLPAIERLLLVQIGRRLLAARGSIRHRKLPAHSSTRRSGCVATTTRHSGGTFQVHRATAACRRQTQSTLPGAREPPVGRRRAWAGSDPPALSRRPLGTAPKGSNETIAPPPLLCFRHQSRRSLVWRSGRSRICT